MGRKEMTKKRLFNKKRYSLTAAEIKNLKIPKITQTMYDCLDFEQVKTKNKENRFSVHKIISQLLKKFIIWKD